MLQLSSTAGVPSAAFLGQVVLDDTVLAADAANGLAQLESWATVIFSKQVTNRWLAWLSSPERCTSFCFVGFLFHDVLPEAGLNRPWRCTGSRPGQAGPIVEQMVTAPDVLALGRRRFSP